jgi:hypothetical protein
MKSGGFLICSTQIDQPGVPARSSSVWGYSPRPALTITGRAAVRILQRFIFEIWARLRREGPDFADCFHIDERAGVQVLLQLELQDVAILNK